MENDEIIDDFFIIIRNKDDGHEIFCKRIFKNMSCNLTNFIELFQGYLNYNKLSSDKLIFDLVCAYHTVYGCDLSTVYETVEKWFFNKK